MLAALAVLALTEGRAGLRRWLAAMARWPRERRWQLAAIAPFLAIGLGIVAATGDMPPAAEFIEYSGTPATVVAFGIAVVINVVGEESGWRGYALPRLQALLGPLRATLVLAALWALWHAPLFLILASYRDFSPIVIPGFFIGLAAGAIVLTSLYNKTGGSILVAAVWHASYNFAAGTAAVDVTIAVVTTACVIFWAVTLVQRERNGEPALGRPPATAVDARERE